MAVRVNFNIECNTDAETIRRNLEKTSRLRVKRIRYATKDDVLQLHPCAVVGGGPSAASSLDILRQWKGDIFAVNDTAKFLSDNGIPHFLYSVDCSRIPYRIGPLTKGALLASRCHRKQFNQFDKKDIRIFDMADDYPGGVTGGPTGVCRAAYLFLRMGYMNVMFFGCDGSFANLNHTHVSGLQKVAHDAMMFVNVDGIDYLTNASLTVQSEYLAKQISKFPKFLKNCSGGLLKAMIEHPDTWTVSAVTADLKAQVERKGTKYFGPEYNPSEHKIWQPRMEGA